MALIAVKTAGLALALNYGAHVGSSMAFANLCVPREWSIWDIGMSMVTTASPVCSFLLSTMQMTQNNYVMVMTSTMVGIVAGVLRPG